MPYKDKEIEKLYYTIGEVAKELNLAASLIRYWEEEFDNLKPRKDRRGNRLFTKQDIEQIKIIHHFVKERGYTIDGAKAQLKLKHTAINKNQTIIESLKEVKAFLEELKEEL